MCHSNAMVMSAALHPKKSKLLKGVLIFFSILVFLYAVLAVVVHFKKNEIIRKINEGISQKIKGNVSIGEMDVSMFKNFPSISVVLYRVAVSDSMYAFHHKKLLDVKEVDVALNWGALFGANDKVKKIIFSDGSITMFRDTFGYSNKYILKGDAKGKSKPSRIPSVELRNIVFHHYDLKKQKELIFQIKKLKGDTDFSDGINTIDAEIDILVNRMIFNNEKGSFLENKKVKGSIIVKFGAEGDLSFNNIKLNIDDQPFHLTGKFLFKDSVQPFQLKITGENILYDKVQLLLPVKISKSLSIVNADQPLDATAEISGGLRSGLPLVNVSWKVKNTFLKTPLQNFEHASFTGSYSDEVTPGLPRTDPNSRIIINDFVAEWNGLPVQCKKIEMLDLKNPVLTCDFTSDFDLKKLNDIAGIRSFDFQQGKCSIRLGYSGPLQNNNSSNSIVNGNITFTNGKMLYTPRNIIVNNFHGNILVRNSDVDLQRINMDIFEQHFVIDANAKNLISMLSTDPASAVINFNITSPSINIERFTYFLQSRNTVKSQGKSINTILSKIDDVLESGKLNISLIADKILYKKFNATNVRSVISLLSDRYIIRNMQMNHAGGTMKLNGDLINEKKNYNASFSANMINMQVSSLFNAFEDFGQDAITSKNLEGRLTLNANAKMLLNEQGKVVPSSITSTVDFLLEHGVLKNFAPVKKMQKFIFKNRNFDTIQFADLKNRLEVNNKKIQINRMEIRSSVIVMYVEGVYAQDGSTDLSIQVPLSNIRKNKNELNLLNLGNEKSGGTSIFLRGRPGSDGNVDFKLDLFNRFKKSHNK